MLRLQTKGQTVICKGSGFCGRGVKAAHKDIIDGLTGFGLIERMN